jgi:DNA-nicking Smr family endonuclease
MSNKNTLSDDAEDAAAVFRDSVGSVRPVAKSGRVLLRPAAKQPVALQRERDEHRALAESLDSAQAPGPDDEKGDATHFLRPGLSRQVLRRLRGGHWVVQEELDLHGLTAVEAKARMAEFLAHALRGGERCVRIIHGKGLRNPSEREPVLKNKVRLWLSQREDVLAYAEARPADGGSGAVVVLLRAPHGKPNNEA